MDLKQALRDWDDPHAVHEVPEAEDIIHALRVELAGKKAVIKALRDDVFHYRNRQQLQKIQNVEDIKKLILSLGWYDCSAYHANNVRTILNKYYPDVDFFVVLEEFVKAIAVSPGKSGSPR